MSAHDTRRLFQSDRSLKASSLRRISRAAGCITSDYKSILLLPRETI
ncbi:hypothetical protein ACS15_4105 [Ralstonia insidiosa]|uniref:Uncharacterized protein n=1 Tax=Ralstonia insidiosa TaxID=190721 RepID=A0AAC9BK12_9RALS|nr:hypothetical protein ACS15_4105 [Ralstonia insidiosa]